MQSMQPQEGAYQPRERSTWQEETSSYEHNAEQPYNYEGRWNIEERGEKLRPAGRQTTVTQRAGSRRRLLLSFLITAIIIGSLVSGAFAGHKASNGFQMPKPFPPIHKPFHNHDMPFKQVVNLDGQSQHGTLTITGNYSHINIHTSKDSAVSIQSSSGQPQIEQNNEDNTIDIQNINGFGSLDIVLPSWMDLNISNTSGNIDAHGSTGNIHVNTNLGDISIHDASGQMVLKTALGHITLDNVNLSGNSTLSSTGHISFNGSLDTSGSYSMTSNTGDVDVTLPSNASFKLDASAGNGVDNSFGNTTVGSDPHPDLSLHTDHGSVHVYKQ